MLCLNVWEQKLEGAKGLCIMKGCALQLSAEQFRRETEKYRGRIELGREVTLHFLSCNGYL